MRTLNLGILAHVDAGKTTLTERLLYAAGVIHEIGSVDAGTTQTDSLALEQQRGITIKSAVASFAIDDVTVNLIDTPGHPDFIAEVERVLSVLDGAVLVISAVEGVQAQTRLLMRALQRLRVPTLIFVNKIDRMGADDQRVLRTIAARLTPAIVPVISPHGLGTQGADVTAWGPDHPEMLTAAAAVLAERDDGILTAYVDDESGVSHERLCRALAGQARRALVHPVFFGSAITGAGVAELMAGLTELLPAESGDPDAPASATVFKVERGPAGEKVAYVRMFAGTIRTRDRLRFGRDGEGKVTAIGVFEGSAAAQRASVSAGEIGKLWGLRDVRIGDSIGEPRGELVHHFAPPTLETVVAPHGPEDAGGLRVALAQLAEQDPLINVRQDDELHEISVSLYGEVQKEVIGATLLNDYGIRVTFRDTTTICVERPIGTGEAVEVLYAATKSNVTGHSSPHSTNPFPATVGMRVEPRPAGSGIEFRLDVDVRIVPLYIFRTVEVFVEHMRQYVREALQEGLAGWQVTDCVVTMFDSGYRAPGTSAGDFRKVTPLVLMQALEGARTQVCEPMIRVRLEIPASSVQGVLTLLARLGAEVHPPSLRDELATIETVLPAARVQDIQQRLAGLTGGEGVLESDFGGYQPVVGDPPIRRRTSPNPLNRDEYLMHARGASG